MISVIRPSKDNTITDVVVGTLGSKTGSNQGKSEILELFVLPEASSSINYGKSRILLQFNLTSLSESIAAGIIPSSSVQYKLHLTNAPHSETQPYSFDLVVFPLSRSWDEGRGFSMFDEDLVDSGFSNWDKATSLVSWSVTGSDFISQSVSSSMHFDDGGENFEVDVSDIVGQWLTGGLENSGFLIKFIDAHETGSLEFFTKKFFSRHTLVPERGPRLEALWSDFRQDDRDNIHYGISGTLFYYRTINGIPQNVNDNVFVNIYNSSSTSSIQLLTASLVDRGVYQVSGVFVNFTSSTSIFRDVWFTTTQQLFTGNFSPTFATGSDSLNMSDITVELTNLKQVYNNNEQVFVKVFAKDRDYKPAIRKSGSIKSSPIFLKEAFYEISHESTGEVLVPFSTGSVKFSKLSYDNEGNYFKLDTKNFPTGSLYRVKILVNYNGQQMIFNRSDWQLKVE